MTRAAILHQEFHEGGESVVAGTVDDESGLAPLADQTCMLQFLEVKAEVGRRDAHPLRDRARSEAVWTCDDKCSNNLEAGFLRERRERREGVTVIHCSTILEELKSMGSADG